jgi:hypothetical protein
VCVVFTKKLKVFGKIRGLLGESVRPVFLFSVQYHKALLGTVEFDILHLQKDCGKLVCCYVPRN